MPVRKWRHNGGLILLSFYLLWAPAVTAQVSPSLRAATEGVGLGSQAAAQDAPDPDPQDQAASDVSTLAGAGLGFLAGGAFGLFYSAIDHPGLPHSDLPESIEYVAPFALAGLLVGVIWASGSPEVTEGVEVRVTPRVGHSDASPGGGGPGWRLVVSFRH